MGKNIDVDIVCLILRNPFNNLIKIDNKTNIIIEIINPKPKGDMRMKTELLAFLIELRRTFLVFIFFMKLF